MLTNTKNRIQKVESLNPYIKYTFLEKNEVNQ